MTVRRFMQMFNFNYILNGEIEFLLATEENGLEYQINVKKDPGDEFKTIKDFFKQLPDDVQRCLDFKIDEYYSNDYDIKGNKLSIKIYFLRKK